MNALQFEGLKVALKQDATGYVLTLKVHPNEIPEELFRDFVGSRYMVAMVRLNEDETPAPYQNRVKLAGMLCRNKVFYEFIQSVHGLSNVDEQAATNFLYDFCEITSRTELNGNKAAQELFDKMMEEYERYSKENLPF